MTIKYHVLEETLLAYAAGELDNASSLLVATHLVGGDIDTLRWRRLGPGVQQVRLDDKSGGPSMRLLKITGGRSVPEHGHEGAEMTMVLAGGFSDAGRSFARGDIEWADADVVHQPVADDGEDCICLAVTDGPLKFFDVIGRLAQPFVGI